MKNEIGKAVRKLSREQKFVDGGGDVRTGRGTYKSPAVYIGDLISTLSYIDCKPLEGFCDLSFNCFSAHLAWLCFLMSDILKWKNIVVRHLLAGYSEKLYINQLVQKKFPACVAFIKKNETTLAVLILYFARITHVISAFSVFYRGLVTLEFTHIFHGSFTGTEAIIRLPSVPMEQPWRVWGTPFIQAWITNYIHYKVWGGITYLFANFNGAAVEVWEWKSNFIHNLISYPCKTASLYWIEFLVSRIRSFTKCQFWSTI